MAAGGMNASTASPNTSGYSGPAPTFGGRPFLNPVGGGTGVARPPAGGRQAGNPMPPPSGSFDAYAQLYSGGGSVNNAMTPGGGGGYTIRQPEPSYGGNAAPMFGNNPPASRSGPSMTPTPPTNPTPAPPLQQVQPAMLQQVQPAMLQQVQPAVMPPYGGPQRGPGSPFGDNMDSFGRRGGYENLPADRMPQQDMFGRERFGFREPPPGAPTWSQQGGVYSYDPNGQQQRGGFNPFGNAPAMPNAAPGRFRQMMQERMQQMRAQPPAAGLGAINPYVGEGPLPGRRT